MTKVLYFTSRFPCWSETFIVREISELIRLGVDVHIVSLKHPVEKMVQSDAAALLDRVIYPLRGVRPVAQVLGTCLQHPRRELSALADIVRGLWRHPVALVKTLVVWWRTLALLPTLRGLAPDHLHAHWATYPSTSAMLASRRLDKPYSFTAHAHDIFLEDHMLAEKMRTAAFGVTISEFNLRYLADNVSPLALQCMRIIHCGVRPADFEFAPAGRHRQLILAVGRLAEIKGFDHLVDACELLARRNVPFECLVIGEGPLHRALQTRIDAAGLSDRVTMLGALKQEEVRAYLARAGVFALPSVVTASGDCDGIPVALMEAMAAGLPVVSTRVSGIPELIEHGSSGLLAEPGDAKELAQCIERLIADPASTREMAGMARRTIEREFDVAIEARKLLSAIERPA
ncbi:glycosyltransferase [Bosea sp. BK604]|uniref:glycosyltransferase n=1 Tax=Bosea sp. BK604 TaxID=2512180 RepID=UPI00104BFEA0|nr:glycosyltransferase [Bosea sp. BK604]TCR66294.1 glycosyltransferase involved in cell wall biosynthesis [Bosea sp. BK604]